MLEKQKQEAMLRMEQLTKAFNLNPKLCKYLAEDRVYYSYWVSMMFGCIDTIEYDPKYYETVKNFEKETGAYVYHAIENKTEHGRILTLLYVSCNEDDWKMERLENNYISAYEYDYNTEYGKFGDVFLACDNGALVRTA